MQHLSRVTRSIDVQLLRNLKAHQRIVSIFTHGWIHLMRPSGLKVARMHDHILRCPFFKIWWLTISQGLKARLKFTMNEVHVDTLSACAFVCACVYEYVHIVARSASIVLLVSHALAPGQQIYPLDSHVCVWIRWRDALEWMQVRSPRRIFDVYPSLKCRISVVSGSGNRYFFSRQFPNCCKLLLPHFTLYNLHTVRQ